MEWTEKWQMSFNKEKCKVLHIGKHNQQFEYKMGTHTLKTTTAEKDVGVLVTNDLKPSQQCARAAKKANSVLGQMSRAFQYRDKITWVRLYKTFVRCHLEYANQSWYPYTQADKQTLEAVQKRAVMMIAGLDGLDYSDRLRALRLDTLEERRLRGDAIMTWQLLSGYTDVNPEVFFTHVDTEPSQATRHSSNKLNLNIKKFRTDLRKNTFSIQAALQWNTLPVSVREAESLNMFKNRYDTYRELLKNEPKTCSVK